MIVVLSVKPLVTVKKCTKHDGKVVMSHVTLRSRQKFLLFFTGGMFPFP